MPKKIKLFIIAGLIISSLCFIFYANSLRNPFIWDDKELVVNNSFIRDTGSWYKAFTKDIYSGGAMADSNFYRPMQTVSYIWDYHFWKLNPVGYHLTNIILQITVSFLVFLFILALEANAVTAIAAALLFATCPLHTEAVTYISGRAEMLMAVFLLSSLVLFIKKKNIIFSLFLFIPALFSKELSVVFPLVILSYVFYFTPENLKKPWYLLRKIFPFFVVAFIYIILRFTILRFAVLMSPELVNYPLSLRFVVLPKVIFTYLKLLLVPVDLHMCRSILAPKGISGMLGMLVLIAVIFFAVFYVLKKKRGILPFMLSWALIFFLPQSGIFPINAFVSEHFIYLSSISFFMGLVYLLRKYLKRSLFFIVIFGFVLFYGLQTAGRNYEWSDAVIFYQRVIKFSPSSFLAHHNLGVQYDRRDKYELAIEEFKKALGLKPGNVSALTSLASTYFKMGKFSDAEREYKLVEKNAAYPKLAEVENNLSICLEAQGKLDEALAHYQLSLRLKPQLVPVHFNIVRIYLKQGNRAAALAEISKIIPDPEKAKKVLDGIAGK